MHGPEDQIFEFGDFILAPRERLLLCCGNPVSLTPKAFDVLVVLVRRNGHLVSKDDLLRQVWPDAFVEEVNLTVHISALRKVLDHGRDRHGMIQTVPTHGYRFMAPVRARDAAQAHAFSEDNADTYRAYLHGRHEWNQRSEVSLKRAIAHFQRANQIDPRFAPAHSGLADCYATLGYLSHLSPVEAFPAARRHATKALALDTSLAEAHASLGFVKLYFDWDWRGGEAEFQRAIALDPSYATTHEWLQHLSAGRGPAFRRISGNSVRKPARPAFPADQFGPRLSLLLYWQI